MVRILYIQAENDVKELYSTAATLYNSKKYEERDAGFDLFVSQDQTLESNKTIKVNSGVKCGFFDDSTRSQYRAYYLYPRSSLSKTPMRLANSVGIIDAGYRGEILAAVDMKDNFSVKKGDRYFQLTAPDLLPFDEVKIVDEIPGGPTVRGAGGFGSTGVSSVSTISHVVDVSNIHGC
jgi:dUTP pyrophosphatase